MPHQRSKQSKIRRYARRWILNHSYHDIIWAETICIFNNVEVVNYIHVHYPELSEGMLMSDLPDAEKGLVLVDSRGRGAYQQ